MEDAQGECLQTYGKRSARVECEGLNNYLVGIEDDFVVASVQSPLISLGRLINRGWSLAPSEHANARVTLVAPDGEAMVPLQFKRNSLAVCASIRVVQDVSGASSTTTIPRTPKPLTELKMEKVIEEENDLMAIQTVIKPNDELLRRIFRRGWATSSNGNPFIIMPESKNYLSPHLVYSRAEWPLRSTAIQLEDYSDYVDAEIEECDKPTFVLTMLHKQEEPFTVFGQVGAQEMIEAGGSDGDPNSFMFPEEPKVPMEMAEHFKPEEVDQVDPRGAGGESAPTFEWQFETKDTLVVNDEPLTINSSIGFLRAAAEYLGVSKNGNKEMIWTRLNQKIQTLEHEQLFLDSNRLYRD